MSIKICSILVKMKMLFQRNHGTIGISSNNGWRISTRIERAFIHMASTDGLKSLIWGGIRKAKQIWLTFWKMLFHPKWTRRSVKSQIFRISFIESLFLYLKPEASPEKLWTSSPRWWISQLWENEEIL